MATHLYVPESVLHTVERAKQWEQAYQYILTKEENMPSFSHILENDNLILKNGGNYRLDPCLGMLESLTDITKYENKSLVESMSCCHGTNYYLIGASDMYLLGMDVPEVFIKRFVLALFLSINDGAYKNKLYTLVEYLLNNYKFFHYSCMYKIASDSIIMDEMEICFNYNRINIKGKNSDPELVSIWYNYDRLVFYYPHLEEFFGKLDGRLLTEDDISLYEMVNGRKPLIYNLEEKLK